MTERRRKPATEFTVGEWTIRPGDNTICKAGIIRRLEPRVMDLLTYFAGYPGEVLGHDRLIQNVWPHMYVTNSALQTAISVLRKAFDDDTRNPSFIETIPKRGYRLVAASSAARPILAVMPFRNLTGSEDPEFLADTNKAKLDITPLDGAELEQNVKDIFNLDPKLIPKAKEILK